MGGNSTESTSTTEKQFRPANTNNPYFSTTTDMWGNTSSNFKNGTAGKTTFDFVNKNIGSLLDRYLNPTYDNPVNQAKINEFNKVQQQNLQNNVLNPLANSNMIRSSQATNMYNNLANQSSDFANSLIANSQNDTWNMINNLMNLYTQGYTGMSGEQANSISSSIGSASTTTKTEGKSS